MKYKDKCKGFMVTFDRTITTNICSSSKAKNHFQVRFSRSLVGADETLCIGSGRRTREDGWIERV